MASKKWLIAGGVALAAGVGYVLYRKYSKSASTGLTTNSKTPPAGSNDGVGLANTVLQTVNSIFGTVSTLVKSSKSNDISGTPQYRTEDGIEPVPKGVSDSNTSEQNDKAFFGGE